MMGMGTWWIKSESDPRWNATGRGEVGMFMELTQCAPAKKVYEEKEKKLGAPPTDLEFGYMKD